MVKEPLWEDLSPSEFVAWVRFHGWTNDPPRDYQTAIERECMGEPVYYAGDVLARPIIEALLKDGEYAADSALEKMLNTMLSEAYFIGHYHALAAAGLAVGSPESVLDPVLELRHKSAYAD